MSLIDPNSNLTAAQKTARIIRLSAVRLHSVMLSSHQEIFNALWETPGVDAQDVLDEFGTDATSLFDSGAAAVGILLSQNPTCLTEVQYLPKRIPTFNPGGTVTLAAEVVDP